MHTMTVLEEGDGGACTLFDFLPRNPTDAATGARCACAASYCGGGHAFMVHPVRCPPTAAAHLLQHASVNLACQPLKHLAHTERRVSAARLLAGGSAAGRVRTRQLPRLPPRRCRLVSELNTTMAEVRRWLSTSRPRLSTLADPCPLAA